MCASISAGVFPAPANPANVSGAPRTAFAPRYATVATVCRNSSRFESAMAISVPAKAIGMPNWKP